MLTLILHPLVDTGQVCLPVHQVNARAQVFLMDLHIPELRSRLLHHWDRDVLECSGLLFVRGLHPSTGM